MKTTRIASVGPVDEKDEKKEKRKMKQRKQVMYTLHQVEYMELIKEQTLTIVKKQRRMIALNPNLAGLMLEKKML